MENNTKNADLHTHSLISDGQLSVGLLIKEAQKNNVKYLSITDHENTYQTKEYQNLSKYYNIELKFIPGIEISTKYMDEEIHILGYYNLNTINEIENIAKPIREIKKSRIMKIIEILKELDIFIPNYLTKNIKKTYNRVNIARFIYSNSNFENIEKVFKTYFDNNSKLNLEIEYPQTEEIITKLNSIGCFTGIAHPSFLKDKDKFEYLKYFTKVGIKGVEVFHPLIDKNLSTKIIEFCQENNLTILGGSDFHGYDTKRKEIGKYNTFSHSAEYIINYIKKV